MQLDHTQQDEYFKQPNPKLSESASADPDAEFGRLCYEALLEDEKGQKLVESIKQRYLINPLVTPQTPNYQTLVIYFDGFKGGLKWLLDRAEYHRKMVVSK